MTSSHPRTREVPGRAQCFHAVRQLQRSCPNIFIRVTWSSRSRCILRSQYKETAFLLVRIARDEEFGICLGEAEVETRGVVLRYSLRFSLDPILADLVSPLHGDVLTAQITHVWRRDDVQGLHCQAFEHVHKYCGARELCGVCSGRHPTQRASALIGCGTSQEVQE